MALGNQLWVSLVEQGYWTRWPPEVPPNLNHSVILRIWTWNQGNRESNWVSWTVLCFYTLTLDIAYDGA